MMRVCVNGKDVEVGGETSVGELLSVVGAGGGPVAVEVNGQLVPKGEHGTRLLEEGDRVELVTLVGGG